MTCGVFLRAKDEIGSFAEYHWRFVGGGLRPSRFRSLSEGPARTAISAAFSRDLRKRGFTFVGSTIVCAPMQAVGRMNVHVTS